MTFQTTRWSLILRAQRPDIDGAKALDELLGAYWQPMYAFYRRLGADRDAAADLTQGLVADLLERGSLAALQPQRGRFRAFLRTCARNWWSNERDRERAQKRGGGKASFEPDRDGLESWLGQQSIERLDAEAVFERRWAHTVLDRAMTRLEREEVAANRRDSFLVLRSILDGSPPPEPWTVLAGRLDTTEGALKVAAHRLRARFRAAIELEVRDTLPEDVTVGDELRELLASLQTEAKGVPRPDCR